jgi:hypothetical protein
MRFATWLLLALTLLSGAAAAVPTDITVRVRAKDAKFIGTSMGGVRITITDAATGEMLAQGITEGGVGDTQRMLEQPRKRDVPLATEDAAAFHATIDIERPRRVEVSAYGPLVYPEAANRVSATQWVVPGKHITEGDAWLLEMPGFFVQITPPAAPFALDPSTAHIPIAAKVVMMCGCPTNPGGLWDSNRYQIEALLLRAGKVVARAPLSYSGNASEYAGALEADAEGAYEAMVYAFDPETGNTGVARAAVLVTPRRALRRPFKSGRESP